MTSSWIASAVLLYHDTIMINIPKLTDEEKRWIYLEIIKSGELGIATGRFFLGDTDEYEAEKICRQVDKEAMVELEKDPDAAASILRRLDPEKPRSQFQFNSNLLKSCILDRRMEDHLKEAMKKSGHTLAMDSAGALAPGRVSFHPVPPSPDKIMRVNNLPVVYLDYKSSYPGNELKLKRDDLIGYGNIRFSGMMMETWLLCWVVNQDVWGWIGPEFQRQINVDMAPWFREEKKSGKYWLVLPANDATKYPCFKKGPLEVPKAWPPPDWPFPGIKAKGK